MPHHGVAVRMPARLVQNGWALYRTCAATSGGHSALLCQVLADSHSVNVRLSEVCIDLCACSVLVLLTNTLHTDPVSVNWHYTAYSRHNGCVY